MYPYYDCLGDAHLGLRDLALVFLPLLTIGGSAILGILFPELITILDPLFARFICGCIGMIIGYFLCKTLTQRLWYPCYKKEGGDDD